MAEAPIPYSPSVDKSKLSNSLDDTVNIQVLDVLPEYPGGINRARNYIAMNLRYPNLATENNVEGTVIVKFVVEKDGRVSDIKIEKGLGSGCDEEVIRVIRTMPKWIPAKLKGKNVRFIMRLPVTFKLSE